MAKLVYIESSPRKSRSKSIQVAKTFLDAYQSKNSDDEVVTVDLWDLDLPSFDGATLDAKYAVMHGQDPTPEQVKAWDEVKKIASILTEADKLLISLPMWNFGVPYKLKHFIDVVTQPGITFTVNESGYQGLLNCKAAVVYASGGVYEGDGAKFDFQKPYVELWLGFIGITDVTHIQAAGTLSPDADKNVAAAMEKAKAAAVEF